MATFRAAACLVLVAIGMTAGTASAGPQSQDDGTGIAEGTENPAVRRALGLLPKRPARIVIIDADLAKPDVRPTLLAKDAFVTPRGKVVYLVKQSEVLRRAQTGAPFIVCVLASIIWHEMAHIEGADEPEAQRREEALWTRFLLEERMDGTQALRYLDLLKKRRRP